MKRRTNLKLLLVIFAFFLMTGVAVGNGGWCDVEIFPEHPTSCDVVVITLSGWWGDSCTPNASAISVVGSNIYFDAIWDYPPDIGCAAVITPWELTRSVGPLPVGTYTIYACLVPYFPFYEPVAEFTVTAESYVETVYYVDAVDGNDLNDGLTPETAFATIQKGIDTAKSGDTIIVAQGTYIGEGNCDIDFYCKAITVCSTDPNDPNIVADTIIDCNNASRGFNFHSNEGPNSILAGLTITNGYSGIHCSDYSCPTISHCIITNNCASHFSVGIWCNNSSPTITNCTISENSAPYGRGIYAYGSNLLIANCLITDNVGADHGGGIYCVAGSNLTIINCTISGNFATFYGGGIHVGGSNVAITNCTISDNAANWGGGGLDSYGNNMTITNCTFAANSSSNGNAMLCSSHHGNLSNVNVNNCIFWNGGDEIQNKDGSTIIITYSDVQGGWPGLGNIDTDPCFADADNGDYHLKSQAGRWDPSINGWVIDGNMSACIDAGNPGCPPGLEPVPNGNRINMGAYGGTVQASKSPANWRNIADLTNDLMVDSNDLEVFTNYWLDSGQCIPSDLNRSWSVDFADLAIFAYNWQQSQPPADGLCKPTLAEYYTAYDNPIEPTAPGYTLPLELNDISNYDSMNWHFGLDIISPMLKENGFAIIEYEFDVPDSNRDDIVAPYEHLRRMDVPIFITSDTLLHLYHIQFDETLKDVEEHEFCGDICDLTAALLDEALAEYEQYTGDLKEAALRNVAYLSVSQKLIQPEAEVSELVGDVVVSELAKIEAHAGFAPSDIFIYREDYSQYVPRGHYTRSEQLKRYFKTMMWYGRMAFLLKGAANWGQAGDALISVYDAKIQTLQAVLLATSLDSVQVGDRTGREVWDRMYAITSFYVGLADDLTPYEYLGVLNKLFGSSFEPIMLEDEGNFFSLKAELVLLRTPEIFGGTGDVYVVPPITPETLDEVLDKTKGMRFMGQRFIPDSYMFQHLVFSEVLDYTGSADPKPFTCGWTGLRWGRCYPRGLDVIAILGSDRAKAILIEEGDTEYINYWLQFDELKTEFDALNISDWNRNLYWGWLYSLRALIDEFPEGYPNFMRTEAWQKKLLNAALASWTELRHDTILYAKQSYTIVEIGLPPNVTGYVEPVPEFYGRLLALTRMTREGLSDLKALSTQAAERLVNLENILSRLIEIANKELMNQQLSEDDYEYIMAFGSILEGATIEVERETVKTPLVADVHTHSVESQVLEEAVGYVDLIIVACPIPEGSIFLAAGPVLSYYEFKHPMSNRLTDEAWRQLLDSPEKPDRPMWFQPLLR